MTTIPLRLLITISPAPYSARSRPGASRKSFGTAFVRGGGAGGSGGAAGGVLPVSGMQLGQMFTTVLKMSTENKINANNAWSLPLIDHMERIIYASGGGGGGADGEEGEGPAAGAPRGGKGGATLPGADGKGGAAGGRAPAPAPDAAFMNFQKASCTLDASIKIWSSRVDDVWSSSYRVLEGMSRNGSGNSERKADAGSEDKENGGEGASATGGGGTSRGASSKVAAVDSASGSASATAGSSSATIERNLAAITAKAVDAEFAVDPLFHKMSRSFDEGGAAGMLLHRLAVHDRCDIAFDSEDCPDTDGAAGAGFAVGACMTAAGLPWAVGHGGAPAVACLDSASSAQLRSMVGRRLAGHSDGSATEDAPAPVLARLLMAAPVAPTLAVLYAGLAEHAAALGGAPAVSAPRPSLGGATSPRAAAPAIATFDVAAAAAELGDGSDAAAAPTAASLAHVASGGSWALLAQLQVATAAAPVVAGGESAGAPPPPPGEQALAAVDEALYGGGPEEDAPLIFGDGGDGDDDSDGDDGSGGMGGGTGRASLPLSVGSGVSGGGGGNEYTYLEVSQLASAGAAAAFAGGIMGGAAATGGSKHWKLKAALKRAAAAGPAVEGSGAAAPAGDGAPAGKRRAAAKKTATQSSSAGGIDFSPTGRLPSDTFVKAKRMAATGSAAAPAAAKAGARGSKAAAAGAPGPLRDSEQLTPAALAKLARGPHDSANAVPLPLWGAHLATLGPAASCLADALALCTRPSVTLAVAAADQTGAPPPPAAASLFPRRSAGAGVASREAAAGAAAADASFTTGGGFGGGGADSDDDDCGGDVLGGGGGFEYDGADAAGGELDASGAFLVVSQAAAAAEVADEEGESGAAAGATGGAPSLVAAGRHVERIRVHHDTTAKRVDVRALKDDMWSYFEGRAAAAALPATRHRAVEAAYRAAATASEGQFVDVSGAEMGDGSGTGGVPEAAAAVATTGTSTGTSPTTFAHAVAALAPALSSAVTVPFYFITVLHLANEHGLQLSGRPGLEDFDISSLLAEASTGTGSGLKH
jgi:hypothetical protein